MILSTALNKSPSSQISDSGSARNGNLEVPVYVIKAKQGYTVRKMEENINGYSFILRSAGMKFRKKMKFRYGMPAYTGPFQALDSGEFKLQQKCYLSAQMIYTRLNNPQ
jgi:hypothetical protein